MSSTGAVAAAAAAAVTATATATSASDNESSTTLAIAPSIVTTTVPMVSVFTPPASCSSRWTYEASTYNGITSGVLIQNAFFVDTECFPPGFQQNGRVLVNQVFSPGVCPEHYSTQQFLVRDSVTTATCCPSDFSFNGDPVYGGCISTFTGATRVAARAGGFGSKDYITSTSISGTYTMWGMPLVVQIESTDRALYATALPPSAAASSTLATTTSSSSLSSHSSASPIQPPIQTSVSSASSGLSAGAQAGVAAGAAVGALLILGLYILWRRGRRKPKAEKESLQPSELQGIPVSEVAGTPQKTMRHSSFQMCELPT
ncbi:uncharacterized protein ACLA_087600 [Aspergillus clavatus NRRL 1]|uniref:Uncharacterized protein n=1 Tax=Aspergillus clavatus (strain ATCC 1007 / CBS 513.65 / DSM 816 / NCTC 3887 / NRRL 1 / QM 1276 / 107) TaxID=344612 RepID=A1CUR7_ASPCL|nr:uncharacterized protein ACLA_087600 [Aspergillus clavatus NRRL 1]EAW07054.1 hypothetical protein ACLA_087600 [Aspergillus clavatus NRRL 1]